MTSIDDRLSSASDDLSGEIDDLHIPPFKPRRSPAPTMLALSLLIALGAFGLVASFRDSGGVSVATQPDVPEDVVAEVPDDPSALDTPDPSVDDEPVPTDNASEAEDSSPVDAGAPDEVDPAERAEPDREVVPSASASAAVRSGQVSAANAGEFFVPIVGNAWNADESRLLLYRTGDTAISHVVIDSGTGEQVANLRIAPSDIEHVYWHSSDPSVLFYPEKDTANLWQVTLDVNEPQGYSAEVRHTFDECDSISSGRRPTPPSLDMTFGLLCFNSDATTKVAFNAVTGVETRAATFSDEAPVPSQSGNFFVERAENGDDGLVLDAAFNATGRVLELDGNGISFVTDGAQREWVAATLFGGDVIGTLVLLPLDGDSAGVVVIGPDRGDPYPPTSTSVSTAGSAVSLSIAGGTEASAEDQSGLVGGVHFVDVSDPFAAVARLSLNHQSEGLHGYWSRPFVSISPSGRYAVYSSDVGSDRVDSFIVDFENLPAG